MSTTKKPFLSSSRSGSATSERGSREKISDQGHEGQRIIASKFWRTRLSGSGDDHSSIDRPSPQSTPDGRTAPHTMRSVMASLNKMAILRQRTIANKGNVTNSIPFRKFIPGEVETEVERIMSTAIKGIVYDPKRSSVLARSLSDTIRNKLKTMKFPRYKFVCLVTIVDKSQAGLIMGSRCLWDEGSDNYATVNVSNSSVEAVAIVYAIHQE